MEKAGSRWPAFGMGIIKRLIDVVKPLLERALRDVFSRITFVPLLLAMLLRCFRVLQPPHEKVCSLPVCRHPA